MGKCRDIILGRHASRRQCNLVDANQLTRNNPATSCQPVSVNFQCRVDPLGCPLRPVGRIATCSQNLQTTEVRSPHRLVLQALRGERWRGDSRQCGRTTTLLAVLPSWPNHLLSLRVQIVAVRSGSLSTQMCALPTPLFQTGQPIHYASI